MKLALPFTALVAALTAAAPADAALPKGARAPAFTADAALGGKRFTFNLADALKKGPVVVYFFPAAFTSGCTVEAHAFAAAADDFRKAGATLIGLTAGNTDRITDFSSVECRDKFPVGIATAATIKGYDVVLPQKPDLSDRTSYVIAKNGRIAFVHSEMNPADHVRLTLAAVRKLKR